MIRLVMPMNEIAQRLYTLIQQKQLSYGELAALTGIPKSAIQRYATGTTEKIPLDRINRLAAALGVSSSALTGWQEETALPRPETEEPLPEEIHMIARAGRKMSPERRQDMLTMLKIAFPEEFRDDDGA